MPKRIKVTPKGPPRTERGEGVGPHNFFVDPEEARRHLDAIATTVPLEEWAGPVADAAELETAHGIARSQIAAWLHGGLLVALPTRRRGTVYPLAQFVGGQPVRGLDEVLAAARNPRVAWDWLVSHHRELDRSPLEALKAGELEAVRGAIDDEFRQQR